MPRNHHTSALLRGCRQVPNWYKWGGRQDPYALEWVSPTSGSEFYSLDSSITGGSVPPVDFTITMWIKVTQTLAGAGASPPTRYGVFGIYDGASALNAITLNGTAQTIELQDPISGPIASVAYTVGAWCNITIVGTPSGVTMYKNGNLVTAAPAVSFAGQPIASYTLGRVDLLGPMGGIVYLDKCVVDEIAFFEIAKDPAVLYNNGIPLQFESGEAGLLATYEVEKPVGAIHNRNIPPTVIGTGLTAPTWNWNGLGVNSKVQVVSTGLRSNDTNALIQMADNYGDYGRGVQALRRDNRTPLGSGNSIESLANGLMPFPAGGGFDTTGYAGAFIGSHDEPNLSPQVSKTITMSTGDSTAYAAQGGPNTLSGKTDARSGKLFPPTFVKKS